MKNPLFLAMGLVFSFSVFALPFDRVTERARMLNLLKHPPIQTLEILNLEGASAENQAFLEHFRDKIWPTSKELESASLLDGVLSIAIDRALYDSDAEKEEWKAQIEEANNKRDKILTSEKLKADTREWAKLAEGLKGPLGDYARRLRDDLEFQSFSAAELPLLERLNKLEMEITDVANSSPVSKKLAATTQAVNQATEDYFSGKISFGTAWRIIEAYIPQGHSALGHDISTRGEALFHEKAVLKSKLAKAKGFKTWADFELAKQARHYEAGYKTAEEKLAFLNRIFDSTDAPYIDFLKKRLSTIPGASFESLRSSQLALLALETETLVREYFPVEKAEALWQETMLENGFSQEMLDHINLDAFPREGKQTHAYMSEVTTHKPKVLRIFAASLSVDEPTSEADWFQSNIFIVQNFRDDGADSAETMFHEGGHASDYFHRRDILKNDDAYGYTEVHSMMMENHLREVEFLIAKGINRKGQHMPREVAEAFVLNSEINAISSFRGQVANAVYDIEAWNYDYDAPGAQRFVDRMRELREKTILRATLAPGISIEGIDWRSRGFATSHFYSGNVRYFGYIVAHIGADMSADTLWNEFEKETGRRTFLRQPSMAPKVVERYYKKGFLIPFPGSVEKFTGQPYSTTTVVNRMLEAVKKYDPKAPSCREIFALRMAGGSR